jgi:hypothetical protein
MMAIGGVGTITTNEDFTLLKEALVQHLRSDNNILRQVLSTVCGAAHVLMELINNPFLQLH